MSKGAELIAAERKRQVEVERWTPTHDAEHIHGQLAKAAACYAAGEPIFRQESLCINGDPRLPVVHMLNVWPWMPVWYKPKDELSDLVRAGALIAAEIDRLLAAKGESK